MYYIQCCNWHLSSLNFFILLLVPHILIIHVCILKSRHIMKKIIIWCPSWQIFKHFITWDKYIIALSWPFQSLCCNFFPSLRILWITGANLIIIISALRSVILLNDPMVLSAEILKCQNSNVRNTFSNTKRNSVLSHNLTSL